MTPCPSRERLALLLAERLGGTEADAVADHVQDCPGCQHTLDKLSGGDRAGPALPPTLGGPATSEPATGFLRRLGQHVPTIPPAPGAAPHPPAGWPRVAGYEVLGELGRGGMGVVYQARQVKLNRLVALKMLLAGAQAGPQEAARFRGEAEAAARLQHPNIVQVYEVGEADGCPYLALEYVEGGSLAQRLRGAPLPVRDAAALVGVLARAVHAAHQKGVIHRDLKPGNVLLAADGTPKVSDFGLAKRLDAQTAHTQTGALLGTPDYMAPEQAEGKAAGPATDVYALGAILYQLLTGRPPFAAETPLDTVLRARLEDAVPPSVLQPKVPRDLETVCLKCLEKGPERRYAVAGELAEELRRFLAGEPIRARPVSRAERALRWAKRQPAAAALLAVSLAAAAILAAATALQAGANQRERRLREAAQAAEQQARERGAEVSRQRDNAVGQRHLAHAALEEIWRQLEWKRLQARRGVFEEYRYYGPGPVAPTDPKADARQREFQGDLLRLLPYYEEFVREEGMGPVTRQQTAAAYRRLGAIREGLNQPAAAAEAYRRAAEALGPLTEEWPGVARYRVELAASLLDLAARQKETGRHKAAAESSRRAQEALQAAARLPVSPPADRALPPGPIAPDYEALAPFAVRQKVTFSELFSGRALDKLLADLPKGPGGRGADVPLDEAVLRKINLGKDGIVRLLYAGRALGWPKTLQEGAFREDQQRLGRLLADAARQLRAGRRVSADTLKDAHEAAQKLHAHLAAQIADLTPSQYIESKRFLGRIDRALQALSRPDVVDDSSGRHDFRGKSVGELVEHAMKHKLQFEPALGGDELAYLAVYHALVLYGDRRAGL